MVEWNIHSASPITWYVVPGWFSWARWRDQWFGESADWVSMMERSWSGGGVGVGVGGG